MNPSTSAPPTRGAGYTDMEPWRRLVQLSLPNLEYESNLKVWEWRVKVILMHISLRNYVLPSGPRPPYQSPEQERAATHCAALLVSCISDTILADLLILLPGKDLETPSVLFERTKRIVKAVQMVRKDGGSSLCSFLSGDKRPDSMKALEKALDHVAGKVDGRDMWRNLILVTALVVKRYGLVQLTGIVENTIDGAYDEGNCPNEDDFNKMKWRITSKAG